MAPPPFLVRNHLSPDPAIQPLLLVRADAVHLPCPALIDVIGGFVPDGNGGFVAAARAANGKFGYLNGEGTWLIAPSLDAACGFTVDGLARFCERGRWGFLDLRCTIVIEPRFEDAQGLQYGMAAVLADGLWRYVNPEGAFVFEAAFPYAQSFTASGLAVAGAGRRREVGYIGRDGTWAIGPRFRHATSFGSGGVAAVSLDGEAYGLIDTSGSWVKRPARMRIERFNEDGLAFFSHLDQHRWGYVDSGGHVVMEVSYPIEKTMAFGLVRDGETGFRSVAGKLETSHPIEWTSGFTAHGFAIARRQGGATGPSWGLLGTDGSFKQAPAQVSEPLTDPYGSVVGPEAGTPLATFATHNGDLVLVEPSGAVAYSLTREAEGELQAPVLRNAREREIWRGEPAPWLPGQGNFFNPVCESYLEGLGELEDIDRVCAQLVCEAEAKLHAFVEDGGHDEPDEYDDSLRCVARQLGVSMRVYHDYLNESVNGAYSFLSYEHDALVKRVERQLIARLTARYGEPGAATGLSGAAEPVTCVWSIPLPQPIAGSAAADANQLWLAIGSLADTGDGDAFFSIYLHCLPGRRTVQAAMNAAGIAYPVPEEDMASIDVPATGGCSEVCESSTADTQDDEENTSFGASFMNLCTSRDDARPRTYDEWREHLSGMPGDISLVAPHLVDDAMADAVVQSNAFMFDGLPLAFQTEARLHAVIRRSVQDAIAVPRLSMTASALALARSLYGEDAHWNDQDALYSQLPSGRIKPHSLRGMWGALIDEALATKAIKAGAGLDDVPRWLRSEALELLALETSPFNVAFLEEEKITTELVLRAIHAGYPLVILALPEAKCTLEVCLAAIAAFPDAINAVPARLRESVRIRLAQDAAWSGECVKVQQLDTNE